MLLVGKHGVDLTAYSISDLIAEQKCRQCGGSIQPNWSYCPYCGTTVSQERPMTAGLTLDAPRHVVRVGELTL